jgi:YcaO-like protein with predicted kinase domain
LTAKGFTLGTHRACEPDETLERISPLAECFGITRIADLTGLDRIGIPVMAAYRPEARSVAVSLGKGVTSAAARVSAMMESIELWHAEHPVLERHWGAARAFGAGKRLADWCGLAASREDFTADTPTAWVEATSLLDSEAMLVPFEAVHTDGSVPEPAGSGWFLCTSNGLASGNNVAEAQIHALCELVERDAVTLWRENGRAPSTLITHRTVTHPGCVALIEKFEAAGVSVLLHDATSDVGLPVVVCTAVDEHASPTIQMGMGCHPSRDVALSRALTEAAQSRLTLISGARDDMFRDRYTPEAAEGSLVSCFKQWAGATPEPEQIVSVERMADVATGSIEDDRDLIVALLRASGFHPCWVDLSREEFGIAVGRAVVPGLQPPCEVAAYHPGRRSRGRLVGSEAG